MSLSFADDNKRYKEGGKKPQQSFKQAQNNSYKNMNYKYQSYQKEPYRSSRYHYRDKYYDRYRYDYNKNVNVLLYSGYPYGYPVYQNQTIYQQRVYYPNNYGNSYYYRPPINYPQGYTNAPGYWTIISGQFPANAVIYKNYNGYSTYYCRGNYNGFLYYGELIPNQGCYVRDPYSGVLFVIPGNYEVLLQ